MTFEVVVENIREGKDTSIDSIIAQLVSEIARLRAALASLQEES